MRILFEGRRAVGVEYRQGGRVQQVRCTREVLLSAGALLSPQLLMLSGIGPGTQLQRHGIAVLHDQPGVGAHLHDHPDVVRVVDAPGQSELFGISLPGVARIVRGVGEWRRQRSGMLTTNFAEAGGFIRSQPSEAAPDVQLHFVIGKLVDHGRKTVLGHGYSCHVCLLQPVSRGSVQLASSDPLALPLVDPNFLGERSDMDRMVHGFRRMQEILAQPALARHGALKVLESDTDIEAFIRQYADTIYHPVGTCRMGPGEHDVVDAQLRVRGVQGLRVVDASIMPCIVSGNTNAPTIMIAEKAVDMVRAAA